jgi:uncharacterized RDD family membrane protein YckC
VSVAGSGGGIVTPEAVRLDFEPAGVGSRTVAILIDLSIQGILLLLLVLAAALLEGQTGAVPDWAGLAFVLVAVFVVIWGYPIGFETIWRGRTPGKAAMGVRVVTVEGAPVRFRHAAVRAALSLVDFYLTAGAAAVVSTLVTARSQRLGDLVAGTIVLRERTGAGPPTVAEFAVPAGAESYAATIDVAGMQPQDYAAVRSFLLRAPRLAPAVRADLAQRLATPLAGRLAHNPPAGTSAELFLACAAARYQLRASPAAAEPGPRPTSPLPAPPPTPRGEGGGDAGGFAPPA